LPFFHKDDFPALGIVLNKTMHSRNARNGACRGSGETITPSVYSSIHHLYGKHVLDGFLKQGFYEAKTQESTCAAAGGKVYDTDVSATCPTKDEDGFTKFTINNWFLCERAYQGYTYSRAW
jgi:hypothetical protein